jgi:mRNA interferase RelE/StbE
MSWIVLYAASAAKSIRKLDPAARKRVRAAVEALATEPARGKPLRLTLRGLRSWRAGDFRIIYRIHSERIEILVLAVGHRREVYDRIRELVQELPAAYGAG